MEVLKSKPKKNPTPKQVKAVKAVIENLESDKPKAVGEILENVGYSKGISENPKVVLESEGFQELLSTYLPESEIAKTHTELLRATKMDHMVFPLGPKTEEEPETQINPVTGEKLEAERTTLTDEEIIAMLAEVNCKVRRIVHGETARHVYFWASDNMARDKALDKAYKLRGRYKNEMEDTKPKTNITYINIFNPAMQEKINKIDAEIKAELTKPYVKKD